MHQHVKKRGILGKLTFMNYLVPPEPSMHIGTYFHIPSAGKAQMGIPGLTTMKPHPNWCTSRSV